RHLKTAGPGVQIYYRKPDREVWDISTVGESCTGLDKGQTKQKRMHLVKDVASPGGAPSRAGRRAPTKGGTSTRTCCGPPGARGLEDGVESGGIEGAVGDLAGGCVGDKEGDRLVGKRAEIELFRDWIIRGAAIGVVVEVVIRAGSGSAEVQGECCKEKPAH